MHIQLANCDVGKSRLPHYSGTLADQRCGYHSGCTRYICTLPRSAHAHNDRCPPNGARYRSPGFVSSIRLGTQRNDYKGRRVVFFGASTDTIRDSLSRLVDGRRCRELSPPHISLFENTICIVSATLRTYSPLLYFKNRDCKYEQPMLSLDTGGKTSLTFFLAVRDLESLQTRIATVTSQIEISTSGPSIVKLTQLNSNQLNRPNRQRYVYCF